MIDQHEEETYLNSPRTPKPKEGEKLFWLSWWRPVGFSRVWAKTENEAREKAWRNQDFDFDEAEDEAEQVRAEEADEYAVASVLEDIAEEEAEAKESAGGAE